jgi:hypothetical protein
MLMLGWVNPNLTNLDARINHSEQNNASSFSSLGANLAQ